MIDGDRSSSQVKEEVSEQKSSGYCKKNCKGVCRCLLEMVRVLHWFFVLHFERN